MNSIKPFAATMMLVLVLHAASALASDCQMPSGEAWVNELGSEMSVKIDASGVMSGTYTSAVGCGAETAKPLTGFCNGHAVTFAVNWQACDAATAWSGTYEGGKISTLWQFVSAKKPSWNSIVAGTDAFHQK